MTKILIAIALASMVGIVAAPSLLVSKATAGWTGRSTVFGTEWSNDRGGPTITCRQTVFGTRCD